MPFPNPRHLIGLLAIALLGPFPAPERPDEIVFHEGKPEQLKAKLVKVLPLGPRVEGQMLEIEVRNRSRFHAEPLAFELSLGPAKRARRRGQRREGAAVLVPRVPLPHYGRAGRAIARGRALRYRVLSPFDRKVKKVRVRVAKASFFEGEISKASPVEILETTQTTVEDFGQKIAATRVKLRNGTAKPVDAIFLAKYEAPEKATSLVSVRLEAGETRDWTISTLARKPGGGDVYGATISRLDPVDWSVIASDGATAARELFLAAWASWRGLEPRTANVEGRFSFEYRAAAKPDAVNETQGRFALSPAGAFEIEVTRGKGSRRSMENELTRAFYGWLRPTASALTESNELRLAGDQEVIMDGPLWDRNANQNLFTIEDGVIVHRTSTENPGSIYEKWLTKPDGAGWLLTGIDHITTAFGKEPSTTKRWKYKKLGALQVPQYHQRKMNIGGKWYSTSTMKLTGLKLGEATTISEKLPQGEAAQEVAKLWRESYRYPERAITLKGRFEITSPATDGVWQGRKRVAGSFVLEGFRGMLQVGSRWKKARFELDGEMTDAMTESLAGAVEDRFRMWAFRDWAGRSAYETEFAGARIVRRGGARPTFAFKDAATLSSLGADPKGNLRLRLTNGLERSVTFQSLGTARVPRVIRTGGEILSARFEDLGQGWLLPTEMRFEKVFGDDWGPEVLRFSKLELQQ